MRVRISSIKINPGRREAEPKVVEELARSIAAVDMAIISFSKAVKAIQAENENGGHDNEN